MSVFTHNGHSGARGTNGPFDTLWSLPAGRALMANDLPMDWAFQRRLLGFGDQPDSLRAAPGW